MIYRSLSRGTDPFAAGPLYTSLLEVYLKKPTYYISLLNQDYTIWVRENQPNFQENGISGLTEIHLCAMIPKQIRDLASHM